MWARLYIFLLFSITWRTSHRQRHSLGFLGFFLYIVCNILPTFGFETPTFPGMTFILCHRLQSKNCLLIECQFGLHRWLSLALWWSRFMFTNHTGPVTPHGLFVVPQLCVILFLSSGRMKTSIRGSEETDLRSFFILQKDTMKCLRTDWSGIECLSSVVRDQYGRNQNRRSASGY